MTINVEENSASSLGKDKSTPYNNILCVVTVTFLRQHVISQH